MAGSQSKKPRYRRMLVDMHIPDWDPAFLSRYSPQRMIELYKRARVDSVLFYCQSHVGLCYWPTKSGEEHAGLNGQDIVGGMLDLLRREGISALGYYSLIFNNWALLNHPEWSMRLPGGNHSIGRYGVVCPNNAEYRSFAVEQTHELVTHYAFDGLFFDMTFWPSICTCDSCRRKLGDEEGMEFPTVVDWFDPSWCRFQTARERWIDEFTATMTAAARIRDQNLPVYHNFATALGGWGSGVPFSAARHHSFLGADFYGDRTEQLLACKTMMNLSEGKPIEFMTSRCVTVFDHVTTKPVDELKIQAFAATLFSAASLFIDAVDPDGGIGKEPVESIGHIYERTADYEPYLGGEAVEDIGVYFSDSSRMDFSQNGTPVESLPPWFGGQGQHTTAVRAVCRVLQEAHLPFGVVTARQLPHLDRYRVVVLPNVSRLSREEAEAFRAYVHRGGRLYADAMTSLTETAGMRHHDFLLADVFGCSFDAVYQGVGYIKLLGPNLVQAVSPQSYVNQHLEQTVRLGKSPAGEVLATLNVPYGAPKAGSAFDRDWASIHTSPPWTDTDYPMIVRHALGDGICVYAATPIVVVESEANRRLFLSLIKEILGEPTYSAEAHPAVWTNVMHQADKSRYTIGFLNAPEKTPALPVPTVSFALKPPAACAFTTLVRVPGKEAIPFYLSEGGTLRATIGPLETFELLCAEYRPIGSG